MVNGPCVRVLMMSSHLTVECFLFQKSLSYYIKTSIHWSKSAISTISKMNVSRNERTLVDPIVDCHICGGPKGTQHPQV